MAILSMPASPRFQTARFRLEANTESFTSPEDMTTQTVEKVGNLWMLDVTLPPLHETDPDAEEWATFVMKLGGMAGRFYAGDPYNITPRGSAGVTPGTPLVNGADQSGKALAIDGAPVSAVDYLKLGDYFAYDTPTGRRKMHKMTASATTNVSGQTTLAFTPAIEERPADNAPILLSPATTIMMLVDDNQGEVVYDEPFYRISFSAQEARNQG
jgi:hypothetical protein